MPELSRAEGTNKGVPHYPLIEGIAYYALVYRGDNCRCARDYFFFLSLHAFPK
jgi:hypothetical protein